SKRKPLRIGHLSTGYHTNFILMNEKNLSKDLKREINWNLFGTGPEIIDAFRKNLLDLAYIGIPPALIGIDQGVKISCIAGGHIEGTLLIAKKKKYKSSLDLNDNIKKTLIQFEGQLLGVPRRGSIHDVLINHYVKKFNLENHIEIKNYDQPELIALDVKNDKISAGIGTPSLAVFASTLFNSHIIIPPEKFFSYNPSYGIVVSKSLINQNPILIKIFLKYHKKAASLLRNHPKKAAKIISKSFEFLNKNYIKEIISISPKYCIALSKRYINSTKQFKSIMFKENYISKKLDITDVFNFNFIKKIHPEQEHYYS
ncbi:MAG: DUF3834 domain-containing protein, partial [Promethearchaeota archaeon]